MATQVEVIIANGLQSQNAITSSLKALFRASKSQENNFKDENFALREYKIERGLYLDVCESFGILPEDIALLGLFVVDFDYNTRANNIYRFTLQLGENVISDMGCLLCANVDGFTDSIVVSFGSMNEITEINANLQIVLITK